MSAADVEQLKSSGVDDAAILELVHVIGFFSHINRVAEALGVDVESWMSPADPRDEEN
ncbi:MAG: hypothetical protein HRU16_01655 [Planctomycetes bacterium]|nr:hypothetical protein [Planctomycetota bacterium]